MFILYADTLPSITQIAQLFDRYYETIICAYAREKSRSNAAFPSSSGAFNTLSTDQLKSMKPKPNALLQGSVAVAGRSVPCRLRGARSITVERSAR